MIASLYQLIAGRRDATFAVKVSRPEAIARLSKRVAARAWSQLFSEHLVGVVTEERVSAWRYTPFNTGLWRFDGVFYEDEGRLILKGFFRLKWMARLFVGFWFTGVIVSAAAMLVLLVLDGRFSEAAFAVAFCLVLLGFGATGLWIMEWISSRDVPYISGVISETLGGAPPNLSSSGRAEGRRST